VAAASTARLIALTLTAAWAAINGFVYAVDPNRRYRAEAAWFIFSGVLIAAALHALAISRHRAAADQATPARRDFWIGLGSCTAVAIGLYMPMLSIGLLSDDFVLLARAQAGVLADSRWEYLRPLPLAIWRALSAFGNGDSLPVRLHAFNIILHGTNAWLTAVLAIRLGLPHRAALVAAVVFLVLPTAVEPVAWASGVFDVLLVTLTLAACIALTTIQNSRRQAVIVGTFTAAALMTKETAVALPGLLAVAAYCSPRVTLRRAALPIALSASLVVLYLAVRIIAGFAAAPPAELSGYALKEIFSRPFGALGLPFHSKFASSHGWVVFVFALSWPALLLWSAARWPSHRQNAAHLLALAGWIVMSIAPVATLLFISADLQGARYLYLGSVAWSMLIAVLVRTFPDAQRILIVTPIVVIFALAVRSHQSSWSAAARERDRVLTAYRQGGLTCRPDEARRLPDHVGGAYVFRNGFAEAIAAMKPSIENSEPCTLDWDGERLTRMPR
jgi:hypothetical protein